MSWEKLSPGLFSRQRASYTGFRIINVFEDMRIYI